jgi:hypothetical protein
MGCQTHDSSGDMPECVRDSHDYRRAYVSFSWSALVLARGAARFASQLSSPVEQVRPNACRWAVQASAAEVM